MLLSTQCMFNKIRGGRIQSRLKRKGNDMKALTALLALAGTAGVGYLVYKKVNEQKEVEEAFSEYKETQKEKKSGGKVHRASMYAVGTIKTTADKISEGIKQVRTEDMVKKGEETVEQMKNTTDNFKGKVKESTGNIKNSIKGTSGNIKDEIKGASGNIKDELKGTTDDIKGELKEIKNLVTSINSTPDGKETEEQDILEDAPVSEGIPEADDLVDIDSESNLFEEIEIVDQL